MRDGFKSYHPLANLIFYVAVIGVTMLTDDPFMLLVSLFGSIAYGVLLEGKKAVIITLRGILPVIIFTALLNPLFNHAGITPLFYMPGGNAVTLEAVLFGISAGVKLSAVVMWFYSLNKIVTSDKIIYLFGKISPYFGLTLSLILGFVPVVKNKFSICFEAQSQFGKSKFVTLARCMLSTAGWVIEGAADTAQSMHGRGFGLKGRTSFNLFIIEKKDIAFMVICAVAFGFIILLKINGDFDFYYYPYVKSFGSPMRYFGSLVYLALCLMPFGVYFKERRKVK